MTKASDAAALLANPLIRDFLKQLHEQVYTGLKKAKTDQAREELAAYGRYADEFEQFFRHYVQTGEMEALQERENQRLKAHDAALMARVREKYNY